MMYIYFRTKNDELIDNKANKLIIKERSDN